MQSHDSSIYSEFYNIESRSIHTKLFKNITESDEFLDAYISAEGQTIKVHRFILSAGSNYFRNILKKFHYINTVPICK